MVRKRRRGAVLLETPKGILMVAWEGKEFMLPGGGAEWWESRRRAAIRELYEEIGLKAKNAKYIFSYVSPEFLDTKGRRTRNYAKVFKVEVEGKLKPKPRNEIKYIGYWKPGSKMKLMNGAKIALKEYAKYLKKKK